MDTSGFRVEPVDASLAVCPTYSGCVCISLSMTDLSRKKTYALRGLFPSLSQPHGIQLLVQIVTRRDLPPVHFGAMRHNAMPLQRHQVVGLVIEQVLLELTDILLALFRVAGTALLLIEIVQGAVSIPAVVGR